MTYTGGYVWAQSKVINHLRQIEGATASVKDLINAVWPDPDLEPPSPDKVLHHIVMFLRRRGFPVHSNGWNGYSFIPDGCAAPEIRWEPNNNSPRPVVRLAGGAKKLANGALAAAVIKALEKGSAGKRELVARVYPEDAAQRLAPWSSIFVAICRLRKNGYDISCGRGLVYSLNQTSDEHGRQDSGGPIAQARGRSGENRAPAGRGRDLAA